MVQAIKAVDYTVAAMRAQEIAIFRAMFYKIFDPDSNFNDLPLFVLQIRSQIPTLERQIICTSNIAVRQAIELHVHNIRQMLLIGQRIHIRFMQLMFRK